MRITLDRRSLLGFDTTRNALAFPENAAKIGTKGTIVPSASHDGLIQPAPTKTTLTFPA